MRKAREVLRLGLMLDLSARQIGTMAEVSPNTAQRYIRLAHEAGLAWSDIAALSDASLKTLLYPKHFHPLGRQPEPNWEEASREMSRKGVTLLLLWHEYREIHPDGLSYPTYTQHYRAYRRLQGIVMRQDHKAGEKLFVDYSGLTMPITDPVTGAVAQAQVFIGVLGCSKYTYLEATASQTIPDWIGSHVRMFEYFGAVPQILVPDNLKSAVSKAHLYDPEINPTYQELAKHYGVAVIPARAYKPRDKADAENGVRLAQRWVLAALRNYTFHSLHDLNRAMRLLMEKLNQRSFKKLPGTRHSRFLELELSALRSLPAAPFELAEWRQARVGPDYHCVIDGHAYSVPYRLAREKVEARLTVGAVEIFHGARRVASHARSSVEGGITTDPAHMPKAHRHYSERSPERLLDWAARVGEATVAVVRHQLESRPHPEAGYRSCLGLQKLARRYGDVRLESACKRAVYIKAPTYTSIQSILKNNLDRQPLPAPSATTPAITHDNVRGSTYYGDTQSC